MDTSPPSPPRLDAAMLRASWREWIRMGTPAAGPRWLQLAWTGLFSAALALGITLLAIATSSRTLAQWGSLHRWLGTYRDNLVVSLCIGYTIHALFALGRRVFGTQRILAWRGWRRQAFFVGIPIASVGLGWSMAGAALEGDPAILARLGASELLSMAVMTTLICVLLAAWFSLRNRQIRAEMRASDAQLRLLQGQMEPHFLFNTLANVISLVDTDAAQAKAVLEAFTEYLRASLGNLRCGDGTLSGELELATRYLLLMQARMGERLRFEIDVPPALRDAAVPPLLLQPLVENAVRHGLEPRIAGGTVRVRGRALREGDGGLLQLCVEDDGAGLDAPRRSAGGNGIALANLRERLQVLFGGAGGLTLEAAGPAGGTRACLVLPLRRPQER
jgi:signal transduction histidine kinase